MRKNKVFNVVFCIILIVLMFLSALNWSIVHDKPFLPEDGLTAGHVVVLVIVVVLLCRIILKGGDIDGFN